MKPVWLSLTEMEDICPSCAQEMRKRRLAKVKVLDEEGNFLKAGFSQGLCDKFGGASGFRTRCMSTMSGKVSDEGAFCNSLKVYCHGSAGAEGKSEKILTKDAKRRYTLGIVYEPDTLDTDNEFAKAEDIEEAAWNFMRELQGRGQLAKLGLDLITKVQEAAQSNDQVKLDITEIEELEKRGVNAMHLEDLANSEVVESFIAPADMEIAGQKVKKGSWLAGIVWDEESFKKIEDGSWTGYSMGGRAKKEKAA